jgi:predicted DNA-binding protein (UPF0251 family)/predicted Fe-Mo cluster-binding NifX family protein
LRPKSCRRVGSSPDVTYFKPRGVPLSEIEEVVLSVDELESLRLADLEGMYQEEAAALMNVSRPTFGRIVDSARKKIAAALVQGKALRIEGGPVEAAAILKAPGKKGEKMYIAVSTGDGKTICGHLGKCRDFIIYETEGTKIKGKRMTGSGGACPGGSGGGHDTSPFAGCKAVITRGMGQGMLNSLTAAGVVPVITSLTDPDEAVLGLLKGELGGVSKSSCTCGEQGS